MKTIRDHFQDSMPADIAAMAIRNTDEDLIDLKIFSELLPKTPADALQIAFHWSASQQGRDFWENIFYILSEGGDFRDFQFEQDDSVDEEDEECSSCDGYGEFAGDPHSNYFPTCSRCNGSGLEPQD